MTKGPTKIFLKLIYKTIQLILLLA